MDLVFLIICKFVFPCYRSLTMTKKDIDVGALLSAPMSSTIRSEVKFWRGKGDPEGEEQKLGYKNISDQFVLPIRGRSYNRQYFHVYRGRLEKLRPRIELAATEKYGKDVKIRSLCDMDNEENAATQNFVVVGTIFKHQELKPNILREISEENEIQIQPIIRGKVCCQGIQGLRGNFVVLRQSRNCRYY